ncbi:MAG TPA: hypothetical protein VLA02_04435 [Reyranella sp.]|nr:hypothetical protein [Reyranella sp.]
MQLPLESVTVVVFPSDAELVEKLPLPPPEWVTVPPGPVVVPLTLPPPAVIDVDMLLLAPGGVSPCLSSTTLQFLSLDDVLLLLVPAPVLAVELLLELVCADAAATPTAVTATNATSAFMGCS